MLDDKDDFTFSPEGLRKDLQHIKAKYDAILDDTDEFYERPKVNVIRQYLEEERRRMLKEGIMLKGDSFHGFFGR